MHETVGVHFVALVIMWICHSAM